MDKIPRYKIKLNSIDFIVEVYLINYFQSDLIIELTQLKEIDTVLYPKKNFNF